MNLLTPTEISSLVRDQGIRPRRSLGQNFLADPNQVRRIVSLSGVVAGDRVLEVGPGLGSLTRGLVDAGARVVAVEADARLAEVCASVVPEAEVVTGDALRVDFAALLDDRPWRCVSNLPYNVAVPVLARLLDEVPVVETFLVMLQAEVGERLVAGPGDSARAAISVKVEYHCHSRLVGRVPPTVFIPPPKVDSVLLSLARRPPPVDVDPVRLFRVTRAAFAQRRKTIRQSLAVTAGSPAAAADAAQRAGVDPTARPEDLSLAEFAALAGVLP